MGTPRREFADPRLQFVDRDVDEAVDRAVLRQFFVGANIKKNGAGRKSGVNALCLDPGRRLGRRRIGGRTLLGRGLGRGLAAPTTPAEDGCRQGDGAKRKCPLHCGPPVGSQSRRR